MCILFCTIFPPYVLSSNYKNGEKSNSPRPSSMQWWQTLALRWGLHIYRKPPNIHARNISEITLLSSSSHSPRLQPPVNSSVAMKRIWLPHALCAFMWMSVHVCAFWSAHLHGHSPVESNRQSNSIQSIHMHCPVSFLNDNSSQVGLNGTLHHRCWHNSHSNGKHPQNNFKVDLHLPDTVIQSDVDSRHGV